MLFVAPVAEELLARSERIKPKDPGIVPTFHNLAWAYFGAGRNAEAEVVYRAAIEHAGEHFPDRFEHAETYYGLAEHLVKQGRFEEVLPLYERAIEIDPNLAEAHKALGNAYNGKGLVSEEGDKKLAFHTLRAFYTST